MLFCSQAEWTQRDKIGARQIARQYLAVRYLSEGLT